jgi:hypothetical protein
MRQVIEARRNTGATHLLPELLVRYDPEVSLSPTQLGPDTLVDQVAITESLKEAGFDAARLQQVTPYGDGGPPGASIGHRHSWVETSMRASAADLNAFQMEVDSVSSSPGVQKVCTGRFKKSFTTLKAYINLFRGHVECFELP